MTLYLEPGLRLRINRVPEIPRLPSGKRKHFFSEIVTIPCPTRDPPRRAAVRGVVMPVRNEGDFIAREPRCRSGAGLPGGPQRSRRRRHVDRRDPRGAGVVGRRTPTSVVVDNPAGSRRRVERRDRCRPRARSSCASTATVCRAGLRAPVRRAPARAARRTTSAVRDARRRRVRRGASPSPRARPSGSATPLSGRGGMGPGSSARCRSRYPRVPERAGPFDEELVRNQDDELNYRSEGERRPHPPVAGHQSSYHGRGAPGSCGGSTSSTDSGRCACSRSTRARCDGATFVPGAFVAGARAERCLAVAAWRPVAALGVGALVRSTWLGALSWRRGGPSRRRWRLGGGSRWRFRILHFAYGSGFWPASCGSPDAGSTARPGGSEGIAAPEPERRSDGEPGSLLPSRRLARPRSTRWSRRCAPAGSRPARA